MMNYYQHKRIITSTEKSLQKLLEPFPSNAILQPLMANWLLMAFLTNLAVTKNNFSGKFMVGLPGQLFGPWIMLKFKMKFLCNKEKLFCA